MKLNSTTEAKIRTFNDKLKLHKLMTNEPTLLKILKGILHAEEEDKHNHKKTGNNKSH
jgi:hypothetical protein